MKSPVEQLQSDALDPSISVATLLRRVKLIAAKLELSDTVEWADSELNGYRNDEDDSRVPPYRKVVGQVKAYSPYHGWQPPAGDSDFIDILCNRTMGDPISALEDLIAGYEGGTLVMLISNRIKQKVLAGHHGWTDMHTEVPRSAIVSVIDHVRNMVLNWAIDLEQKGITGEGVTFSSRERQTAQMAHVSIENFQGNLNTGTLSIHGGRVNLASTDQSTNVIADSIFGDIESAVNQGIDHEQTKDALLEAIAEMRREQGRRGFVAAYQKFVGLAADHLTLLGPFLPALTALVASN